MQSMDSDASRAEVLAAAAPAKPGFRWLWTRGTRRWSAATLTIAVLLLVLGGGIFWRYGLETAPPSAADARPSMASTSKSFRTGLPLRSCRSTASAAVRRTVTSPMA